MRGARKRVTASYSWVVARECLAHRAHKISAGRLPSSPDPPPAPPHPPSAALLVFTRNICTNRRFVCPFFALLPFVHRLRPPNDPSSPPTQLVPRAVSTTRSYRSIPGHKCGACKLHQQRRIINECCCARICSAALFHRSACPARGCVSRIPVNRIMYARVQRATFSNADVISPKLHYVTMYFRTSISLRRLPFNQDLLPLSRSVLRPISKLLTLN